MDHNTLWREYPELPRLWGEYTRVCNDRTSSLSQCCAAYGAYERAYILRRDRNAGSD